MKFGIVRFPGSNCDTDAYHAVVDTIGEEAVYLWHKDHDLQDVDVVILPGGFAYGDYLRAGAIARFSPIMTDVIAHAKRGGPVLAICNGFQVACEAGLLPGALMRNAGLQYICEPVRLRVETTESLFSSNYSTGQIVRFPIAHGEGRYTADDATLDELESKNRVIFRYHGVNPNGSARDIAGIVNEAGNVLGIMPHPERVVDPLVGGDDGLAIFSSLLARVPA
ncbi:MAG TPA: phosphoribosylformylglycinamidine synthase subunit PurQ [Gemmatimonadaceae bacterium]|jgi:phosphoribosylformylglycinamidine synthase I|nr:phosphoribosylformylglycinamidine synthase subunit PurQ [Gemmatimonadaceae bacterium]